MPPLVAMALPNPATSFTVKHSPVRAWASFLGEAPYLDTSSWQNRFGSLYLVMQWLPWEITKGLNALYEGGTLSEMAMLVLSGIVVGAYLFYPLFASVMMTMHKPLFYEKISRTQVVSTVKAAR